jgi:imidazolonepropionase-like amidohydrolase
MSEGGKVVLFINVHLIPMTHQAVIPDQAVLVEGARITQVGPSAGAAIPDGGTVLDGKGAYLMPGLADMHMHTREEWMGDFWPVSPFALYLANGVTTIRDNGPIGETPTYVFQWRDQINEGSRSGPAIYSSGPPLLGPVEHPRRIVEEQKAQGFDFVKLYSFLSRDEFHQAMTAAAQLGMYVAGHIPFAVGLDGVVAEGMDEIAHIEELDFELIDFDRGADLEPEEWFAYIMTEAVQQYELHLDIDVEKLRARLMGAIPAVVEKLSAAHVPVSTTMVVGNTIVQKLFEPESFLARPENRYLPADYVEAFRRGEGKHQRQFKRHEPLALFKAEIEKTLLRELHRAGVPLLLGTDAGTGTLGLVPGFSTHDELRILTESGLTPYDAIATGTVNAATVVREMTGKGDFGTIEEGQRADLILVPENPLEDVSNIRDMLGVMASGRWYAKDTLASMIAF